MQNKVHCRNMNHGKLNPAVGFCPNCGERFKSASIRICNEEKHRERLKTGCTFCFDCGKRLKKAGL